MRIRIHSKLYYLQVRARSFGQGTTREYFGPYTIAMTGIGGTYSHVNNVPGLRSAAAEELIGTPTDGNNNLWKATSFTTGAYTHAYGFSIGIPD